MVGEPKYDEDVVNLGYLNSRLGKLDTELGNTNTLLLSKTQNFGTLPKPPYYRYDTYMGPDGIYICHTERLIGEYNALDWGKASTYENVGDAFDRGIITAGTLQAVNGGANAAGLTGQGTGNNAIRLWSGSTYANRGSAPLRITQGGHLYASNADISGKITATSGSFSGSVTTGDIVATGGTIGGWTVSSVQLQKSIGNYSFEIRTDRAANLPSMLVYDGANSRYNFYIRPDGFLYARSAEISGTITGSTISGSTISGTNANFGNQYSGGYMRYYNGVGFLSCGVITDHPWMSAVNLATTGGGVQGINFKTGNSIGSVGSDRGFIAMNTANAMNIASTGTININNGRGGNVGIKDIVISGSTITGNNGGYMYANSNCMLSPISGYHAYVNSTSSGNRIAVSSAGPSSRNVKKNIRKLSIEEYENIYKDIQQLENHSFQYKYENIKEDKDDFGFIIDEIEALPTISKYAKNYNSEACVDDNKFIPKRDNDETQDEFETLEYKEWDRDSYIKTLMLMIKSMQIKIDELEEKIGGK